MTLELFAAVTTRDSTPGPGAYEKDPYTEFGQSLRYSIRPRYPEKAPLTANVDYPKNLTSLGGPKYTIGSRPRDRDLESSVGPNYLPDSKELFPKSVHIQGRYKDKDTSKEPGPADYSPQDWPKQHIPVQGGRGPINLDIIPDSPGPAAYSTRRRTGIDAPKTAIRPKTAPSARREKNPGYTYNDPSQFGKDGRKYTVPKAPSGLNRDNGVPGPGAYDPDPFLPEKVRRIRTSIGSRASERKSEVFDPPLEDTREFPKVRNRTIGPYTEPHDRDYATLNCPLFMPDSTLDRKSLTIGQKFPQKPPTQTPGPTDYYPEHSYSRSSSGFSVKGPESRDAWLTSDHAIPGPGAYSINRDTAGIKWTIGDRSRGSTRMSTRSRGSNYDSRRATRSQMSTRPEKYYF